jgi:hypothetical protein
MKMTIFELWGVLFVSMSGGIFLAGFISDRRIAALRRRREREQKDALRSGAILAQRKGGEM